MARLLASPWLGLRLGILAGQISDLDTTKATNVDVMSTNFRRNVDYCRFMPLNADWRRLCPRRRWGDRSYSKDEASTIRRLACPLEVLCIICQGCIWQRSPANGHCRKNVHAAALTQRSPANICELSFSASWHRVTVVVHVNDFVCIGSSSELKCLFKSLHKEYDLKTNILELGRDHAVRYLKRMLRRRASGIVWLRDPKHMRSLVREYGMEGARVKRPLSQRKGREHPWEESTSRRTG